MIATEIPLDTNIPIQECSIPEVQALVSSAMAAIRILTSIAGKHAIESKCVDSI